MAQKRKRDDEGCFNTQEYKDDYDKEEAKLKEFGFYRIKYLGTCKKYDNDKEDEAYYKNIIETKEKKGFLLFSDGQNIIIPGIMSYTQKDTDMDKELKNGYQYLKDNNIQGDYIQKEDNDYISECKQILHTIFQSMDMDMLMPIDKILVYFNKKNNTHNTPNFLLTYLTNIKKPVFFDQAFQLILGSVYNKFYYINDLEELKKYKKYRTYSTRDKSEDILQLITKLNDIEKDLNLEIINIESLIYKYIKDSKDSKDINIEDQVKNNLELAKELINQYHEKNKEIEIELNVLKKRKAEEEKEKAEAEALAKKKKANEKKMAKTECIGNFVDLKSKNIKQIDPPANMLQIDENISKVLHLFKLISSRLDTIHDFFDDTRNFVVHQQRLTIFKGIILRSMDSTILNKEYLMKELTKLLPNSIYLLQDLNVILTKSLGARPKYNINIAGGFEDRAIGIQEQIYNDVINDNNYKINDTAKLPNDKTTVLNNEEIAKMFDKNANNIYYCIDTNKKDLFTIDENNVNINNTKGNLYRSILNYWDASVTHKKDTIKDISNNYFPNDHIEKNELNYVLYGTIDKDKFHLEISGIKIKDQIPLIRAFINENYYYLCNENENIGDNSYINTDLDNCIRCIMQDSITVGQCDGCPSKPNNCLLDYKEFNNALDIKRSGDAFQRLRIKSKNINDTTNYYVFVTIDKFAYFMAKLYQIPAILIHDLNNITIFKPEEKSININTQDMFLSYINQTDINKILNEDEYIKFKKERRLIELEDNCCDICGGRSAECKLKDGSGYDDPIATCSKCRYSFHPLCNLKSENRKAENLTYYCATCSLNSKTPLNIYDCIYDSSCKICGNKTETKCIVPYCNRPFHKECLDDYDIKERRDYYHLIQEQNNNDKTYYYNEDENIFICPVCCYITKEDARVTHNNYLEEYVKKDNLNLNQNKLIYNSILGFVKNSNIQEQFIKDMKSYNIIPEKRNDNLSKSNTGTNFDLSRDVSPDTTTTTGGSPNSEYETDYDRLSLDYYIYIVSMEEFKAFKEKYKTQKTYNKFNYKFTNNQFILLDLVDKGINNLDLDQNIKDVLIRDFLHPLVIECITYSILINKIDFEIPDNIPRSLDGLLYELSRLVNIVNQFDFINAIDDITEIILDLDNTTNNIKAKLEQSSYFTIFKNTIEYYKNSELKLIKAASPSPQGFNYIFDENNITMDAILFRRERMQNVNYYLNKFGFIDDALMEIINTIKPSLKTLNSQEGGEIPFIPIKPATINNSQLPPNTLESEPITIESIDIVEQQVDYNPDSYNPKSAILSDHIRYMQYLFNNTHKFSSKLDQLDQLDQVYDYIYNPSNKTYTIENRPLHHFISVEEYFDFIFDNTPDMFNIIYSKLLDKSSTSVEEKPLPELLSGSEVPTDQTKIDPNVPGNFPLLISADLQRFELQKPTRNWKLLSRIPTIPITAAHSAGAPRVKSGGFTLLDYHRKYYATYARMYYPADKNS